MNAVEHTCRNCGAPLHRKQSQDAGQCIACQHAARRAADPDCAAVVAFDARDSHGDDPVYLAYLDDLAKRHEQGRDYPIGERLPCWECEPKTDVDEDGVPCVLRECVARGPITNRADPTQTYRLACGHLTI